MKASIFALTFIASFFLLSPNNALAEGESNSLAYPLSSNDSLIYNHIEQQFINSSLDIGNMICEIGKDFEGTPYVAHTLEQNEDEQLVVKFSELDCTTFVEYTLALATTFAHRDGKLDTLEDELQNIRYRSGEIDGYCSRLHYFTDWLQDNERMQYIAFLDSSFQERYVKPINFMSTHTASYDKLLNKPREIAKIKDVEEKLNSQELYYIPKNEIADKEQYFANGDIIAFTSAIKGLDVSHVGFVIFVDGQAHLLHASSEYEKVMISKEPIAEYISNKKSMTGIMIARPQ